MGNEIQNKSLVKLLNWLKENGWAGYDPYDIKGHPFVIWLIKKSAKTKIFVYIRETVFELFYSFPRFSRWLFRIEPQINAKAMGLFAKAYLDFYLVTKEEKYLGLSKDCLRWLINNISDSGKGIKWAYPFDWQSTAFIPKGTPNGIVTTAVGDAYWSWYKHSGEKEYLDVCVGICEFLETLPQDALDNNRICFSYTPLYINHVHNLNLFVAEFLIKVGLEINNETWVALGNRAINYTLSDQKDDGSFDYNGPPEKAQNFIDNYHTGFVLRMLHSIWKLTQRADVYAALKKCYKHYIENFFEDASIPWLKPNQKYRIDIHSCAESINCLSELSEAFPEGKQIARKVLLWTIEHLQDKQGYFYYGINKSRIFKFSYKSKIAYIRWGQAWMMKALSSYYKYQSDN